MTREDKLIQTTIETSGFSLNEEQKDNMTSRLHDLATFDKNITSIEMVVSYSHGEKIYHVTIIVFTPGKKITAVVKGDHVQRTFNNAFDVAKRNVTKHRKKKIGL